MKLCGLGLKKNVMFLSLSLVGGEWVCLWGTFGFFWLVAATCYNFSIYIFISRNYSSILNKQVIYLDPIYVFGEFIFLFKT